MPGTACSKPASVMQPDEAVSSTRLQHVIDFDKHVYSTTFSPLAIGTTSIHI